MRIQQLSFLIALLSAGAVSCAGPRAWHITSEPFAGGVVATRSQTDAQGIAEARSLMSATCEPGSFEVVQQAETRDRVFTTSSVVTNQPYNYSAGDAEPQEWRMEYRCLQG